MAKTKSLMCGLVLCLLLVIASLPQKGYAQDQLRSDESLMPGQSRTSANHRYTLSYQSDGNLVLYKNYPNRPSRAIWASNTANRPSQVCVMQADGNLVIYASGGRALWASNTDGNSGSRLVVQDDGNVVIYRPNNSAAWATGTVQQNQLLSDESLARDQSLKSLNGRYMLIFQSDGNLVLYKNYPNRPAKAIWASNTAGRPGQDCLMQADGNLVIYASGRRALWASNTDRNPGSRLVVQDDGNVVIYRPNSTASWATGTPPPNVKVIETRIDRCSNDVFISMYFSDELKLDQMNGIMLTRNSSDNYYSDWITMQMPPHSGNQIRWWCHSTTGNWADPGTWRITNVNTTGAVGGSIRIDESDNVQADPEVGAKITFEVTSSAQNGWTPEHTDFRQEPRTIRARLGPGRLLEIQSIEIQPE